jgi:predicted nucleic acid-binding protein
LIIVSNSSPLIGLGAIGRLELLHGLFGEIFIPDAVVHEVRSVRTSKVVWVVPRPVEDLLLAQALEAELDRGEAEAIALALELKADLLLMDERRGRRLASGFGLKVLGVLGVLVAAKRQGLIEKVEPLLLDLREGAGFRVSEALFQRALEEAGEG